MSDEGSAFASFERKWLDANPEQAAVLVFLPPSQRGITSAFGSLIHELAQTAFVVREPQVAAAKLSWWQQELVNASARNPRHPITRELFRDARTSTVDPPLWRALIDGAMAQLDVSFPSSFGTLFASLSGFFAPVAAIETQVTGGDSSQSAAIANLWICSHLLLVAQDASDRAEQTSMPLDLLARHGVSRADLATTNPNRIAVLKDFVGRLSGVIKENRHLATHASLSRLVRARSDCWLAHHGVRANDPKDYLTKHTRNMRWRSLWWAWHEARHLTSHSAVPNSKRAA